MVFWVCGLAGAATPQQVPVLRYTPPGDTYRSAITPPEDYSFSQFNASVQFYQFHSFDGNPEQAFRRDLLRQVIDPRYREENATQVQFGTIAVPGADKVVTAAFIELRVGVPRPHNRVLIIAGAQAAIVDASAPTAQSWGRAVPALQAMIGTLRVEAAAAPPDLSAGPGAGGARVAGLYMGTKAKYMASMINVIGHGYYQNALHFYLLSAQGRVYRAYDRLDVPDNNPGKFDFDAAAQRDPDNSGRFSVVNGQLYIRMNGPRQESITVALPKDGLLTIDSILYQRR